MDKRSGHSVCEIKKRGDLMNLVKSIILSDNKQLSKFMNLLKDNQKERNHSHKKNKVTQ